mmetsp:Transcript_45258/g.72786  ORF Transcript_45258/g.72786 Transcript_45258/m.72786 type:complete len:242 (-) Transcript_45258:320-1045(-)
MIVALTIDDAPSINAGCFRKLLDILRKYHVKVTFFIISGHITTEEHRDLMIQAANDGHFFANHMTMDTPSIWFSRDEFKGKLKECQKVVDTYQLSNATQNLDDECGGLLRKRRGKRREDNINDMKKSTRKKEKDDPRCKFFRPPSAMQNFTMASVLKELKYVSVLADAYSGDPAIDDASFHASYLYDMARPGSILLMHSPETSNHRIQTIKVLELLLPRMLKAGFQFATLKSFHPASSITS